MRINHNMMAMNTGRQLGINSAKAEKSVGKLSSGLRINNAADDAAGLAISEKMRGQIRGLTQASRNAQDGVSMLQTAEGALNETHSILQRMRELATQSSNDTNTETDRSEIQKEMNQLTSEINRIGNTTEFNTQSLLKGDGKSNLNKSNLVIDGKLENGEDAKKTQAIAGNTVSGDASAIKDGDTITYTINGESLKVTFDTADTDIGTGGEVKTSTVTGNAAHVNLGDDFVDTNLGRTEVATATKDALQAMIDANDTLKGQYEVKVQGTNSDKVVIEAVKDGDFDGAAGNIAVASSLTTATFSDDNTIKSAGENITAKAASKEIDFSDLSINTESKVEALVGKGMTINGQQIEFYNANDGEYNGDAIGINLSDAISASSNNDKALATTLAAQIGANVEGVDTSAASGVLTISASVAGASGNSIEIEDGGIQKDFKANFQVGANKGQTMTIEISDMRASALGLTGDAGSTGFSSSNNVTDGTNNTSVEAALDVSTSETSSNSIETINKAIETVSAERSKLGAYQNRLDHTIKNLGTSSENLTAAESRIRDVDMAKEMMEFTKNNILQQAAQSMMAQAKSAPQGVLQLLR